MKRFIKSILTNMMLYAIILVTITIFSRNIIIEKGMEFKLWFYIAIIAIGILFFVIGIIQIFCKIHDGLIKSIFIMTLLAIVAFILLIAYFIYDLEVPVEYIIQKDDKKYVIHEYSYLTTKIIYYDNINLILRGKDVVLTEEYDKDEFNRNSITSTNNQIQGEV